MTGTIAKVISEGFGLIQGEDGHEYFMRRSAARDGSGNTRGFGNRTRTPRKAGGARKAGSA
jgi:hypothetical protein